MRRNMFVIKRVTVLFILLGVCISSYLLLSRLFLANDNLKSKEYQYLASIPPELIITMQVEHPSTWKDYISVISLTQTRENSNTLYETTLSPIIKQLDEGTAFNNITWDTANKKWENNAKFCRKLLDHYPFYEPREYLFPLKMKSYYIDTYGAAREDGNRRHEGTDIFNKKGTPIFSVCDGIVEKSGWNRLGGERVGIRGTDGNYYYYAHLDKINNEIAVGDSIQKGELIGTMGNTGDALTTPDHLHFGIELPNGEWINPYAWLKVWEYNSDVKEDSESTLNYN